MSARTFNLGTEAGSGGSSVFLVCDGDVFTLRRPAFRKPAADIVLTREQLRNMLELVSSLDTARAPDVRRDGQAEGG